jgi:hypothetical protein
MTLNPHELKLASVLLELASDLFSSHVCNDFDLVKEAGLTDEEAYEINQEYVKHNGDSEDWSEEELKVSHSVGGNDGLMGWLAARMKEESEQ